MEETRGIADVVQAVEHPSAALDDLMASEDATEGMSAFAAKRRVRFVLNFRDQDVGCSITASGPGKMSRVRPSSNFTT